MKIIHADGSIEDRPDNYRHQWSPADILAIEIPPENRPLVGSSHHKLKRKSPEELRAENQKRMAIVRQAKAEKRKPKTTTNP
ncbi:MULTISPECIES: hypothetical protein [unclassified Microcoleus]|uniref:hypothetical protein n=1 Tax=unclassified Microcoleus TaxID=2642155 RepID=UPI002FD67F42